MRIVTLCLLVLASVSCLLVNVESGASIAANFEEVQPFEFEDIQAFGDDSFWKEIENIFRKVLSTIDGVNCTFKEVIKVMTVTTDYIDAIGKCTGDVPKDIAKIVKQCQKIITICEKIIHLKSSTCNFDENTKMPGLKCFGGLLELLMKLTRSINVALKLMVNFPFDTEDCYVDATRKIQEGYNAFIPGIKQCVEEM